MICDLHTHSIYSDGTSTPQELIDKAIDAKIAAIALTDHNTVDGLPSFVSAANGKNIDIILGSEFSTDYKGKELLLTFPKLDFVNKTDLADKIRTSLGYEENHKIEIIDVMVTCFTLNVY